MSSSMPGPTTTRDRQIADIDVVRQAVLGCYFGIRFLPAALFFILVLSLPIQFVLSSVWFWVFIIVGASLMRNRFAYRIGSWLHPNVDPVNLRLSFIDRDFNENDYEMLLALDDAPSANKCKGTAESIVRSFPCRTFESKPEVEEVCAICLEVEKVNESIRQLPCHHEYHTLCIDKWLQQSTTCPTCKFDLLTVLPIPEQDDK
eukprot:CFRG2097T1